jgi:aminocarboxymuconate-semialdehyde decarboxylase
MTDSTPTIDHQAHWYPKALLEALAGREGYPTLERADAGYTLLHPPAGRWRQPITSLFYDLDQQFADMSACGVDVMLASPAMIFDVALFELPEARDLATMANEEYAATQRAHPDRFLGLATLPMRGPDVAVEVLDDAILRLGLKGVCMHANVGGSAICRPELEPVWDRIEELGVPVVLHPTRSVLAPTYDFMSVPGDVMVNWLLDTSAAAVSLIMSGTFDRLPRLVVLHPHIGGTLPYVVGRLDSTAAALKSHLGAAGKGNAWKTAELPSWYLKNRFWTDSSSTTLPALKMALDVYGADRITLGSDVPYVSRERHLNFLREHLPAEQVERILTNRLPGLVD